MKDKKNCLVTNEERLIYQSFKDTLIGMREMNQGYLSWEVVKQLTLKYYNKYFNNGLDSYEHPMFKNTDKFRTKFWPLLQTDIEWMEQNGYAISRNGVGIKISNDSDEVEEFIKSEIGRAMAVLKKLKPFKQFISNEFIKKEFAIVFDDLEDGEEDESLDR